VIASDQSDLFRDWKALATRLGQRWSPSVNHVVRTVRRVSSKFSNPGNQVVPRVDAVVACCECLFTRILKPSQLHLDLLPFVCSTYSIHQFIRSLHFNLLTQKSSREYYFLNNYWLIEVDSLSFFLRQIVLPLLRLAESCRFFDFWFKVYW